jgi:hypothetical protein
MRAAIVAPDGRVLGVIETTPTAMARQACGRTLIALPAGINPERVYWTGTAWDLRREG